MRIVDFDKEQSKKKAAIAGVDFDAINDLPIHSAKLEIIKAVRENQAVIIMSETGSGKTTRKFLLA